MATTTPARRRKTAARAPAPPDDALGEDSVDVDQEPDGGPVDIEAPDAEDDAPAKPDPEKPDGEQDDDAPLLDLSTQVDRPFIKVDGDPYELAVKDDFGIEEQHRLTAYGRRFDELFKRNNLSEKDRGRLKLLLDYMFDKVLLAPDEIKRKLGDDQRSQVVLAFTYAPLAKAVALMQAAQAATGEAQAGNGSTSAS